MNRAEPKLEDEVQSYCTTSATTPDGFDLLRILAVRAMILWHGFPYVFQAFMLLVFIGLSVLGWRHFAPAGVSDKLFAKANLVNLLIWGLWWPAMVWVAALFGRVWCTICPLELVSSVSERLSRRVGIRQRHLHRWMVSGSIIVVLYAAIQLLVAGAQIHRVPHYTSLFLVGLLALSIGTGLFLKNRAFCRGFCPIGLLLGTYGRGGMLAVRSGAGHRFKNGTGKDCIMPYNRTELVAESCPSLLNPPKLNSNRDCVVCGQCIKASQPGNMQLLLRRPFHPNDAREPVAAWPVALFVMLVSGFVTYELCSEWAAARHVFGLVPTWMAERVGVPALSGYINGVWRLFVVPLAAWVLLGLIVRLLSGGSSLGEAWRRLALPLAVVIASGHMAKGLAKFVSWVGFLPDALADPKGVDTVLALTRKTVAPPAALLPVASVSGVGLALLAIGLLLAIREARRANPARSALPVAVPLVLVAGCYSFLTFGWR